MNLLRRLVRWGLGDVEAHVLLGEMEELYRHKADVEGRAAAERWRRREVRRAAFHVLAAWAHHPTLSQDEGDYMAVPDLRVSRVLLRMRRAQPPLSSPRRLARALPVSCHRNVEVSR